MRTIRIATRKSPLALWQANYVRAQLLTNHHDLDVVLLELVSEGDKTLDVPLSAVGGKGLFLKELEQALLRGEADIAVHSMKDVTVTLPDGLDIVAICQRDDPRDVLISNRSNLSNDSNDEVMHQLPPDAVVGTSSLRRQCQIRARFPHWQLVNLRGNVNTRLNKLDHGEFDAIVLAAAGIKRLQLEHRIAGGQYLAPEICLPAVGQGAVGIECRSDDTDMRALLETLNHDDTALCVNAERAANERLGGGCQVPLAVYAELAELPELQANQITIRALVGSVDGATILRSKKTGNRRDAIRIGCDVADDLLAQGAGAILDGVYGK